MAAIHAIAEQHPAAASADPAASTQHAQDEHAAAVELHRAVQRVFTEGQQLSPPDAAAAGAVEAARAGREAALQQHITAVEDLSADMDDDDEVTVGCVLLNSAQLCQGVVDGLSASASQGSQGPPLSIFCHLL